MPTDQPICPANLDLSGQLLTELLQRSPERRSRRAAVRAARPQNLRAIKEQETSGHGSGASSAEPGRSCGSGVEQQAPFILISISTEKNCRVERVRASFSQNEQGGIHPALLGRLDQPLGADPEQLRVLEHGWRSHGASVLPVRGRASRTPRVDIALLRACSPGRADDPLRRSAKQQPFSRRCASRRAAGARALARSGGCSPHAASTPCRYSP